MGQRRIIDIPYPQFREILKIAVREKKKIDPYQKEPWAAYVKKHRIPEAAFRVRVNSATLSGKTEALIIEGTAEHDGYYRHSVDEQVCMKFESGVD